MRELEDLIIDAIYLDILHGKLDQKEEQLEVTYTMGRDLEPGQVEAIQAALQHWQVLLLQNISIRSPITCTSRASTTASVLSTLDTKINVIAAQSQLQKQYQQEYDRQLQFTLKEVHDKHKDKGLGGPGSGLNTIGERAGLLRRGTLQIDRENMMDVDELDGRKGRRYVYVSSICDS